MLAAAIAAGVLAGLALIAVVLAGGGGGVAPTVAAGPPHFVEEAAAAGLVHTYDGDSTYSVGGGVAVFDCNHDGRPDMYLAGGSNPAVLERNDSPLGGTLRFVALSDPAIDLTNVNGAYPIDIDGDGEVDLVVLRAGESVLLKGLGDCRFQRANEAWSFAGGNALTEAFSATWEGAAKLPTLAFGNYLGLDASGQETATCAENSLVRPDAAGTGYASPMELTPGLCALSMLFSDWSRSGRSDLRVSNDRHYYDAEAGQEQLWRVVPGEAPRLYAAADGWVQVQVEGMGIGSFDVTGDGYPDVFLTSQAASRLQTLTSGPSQPTYRDIGLKRGVNAQVPFTGGDIRPSTAWHPEFQDVNNDGFTDLFISKGNVNVDPDFAQEDPSNLFIGQADGTFVEGAGAAGIVSFVRGRGAALADFNLDGLLDLVEVNYRDRVLLWRDVGAGTGGTPAQMGNWLALQVTEPGPNRDAIGAWVEVRVGDSVIRRELTVGGGHAGGQLGWIHFGIGSSGVAEVRVQWPGGETGPWLRLSANQFAVIDRTTGQATRWLPPGS